MPSIVLYFTAFLELWLLNNLWKMRGYPQLSFCITLAKICFPPIVITCAKVPLCYLKRNHTYNSLHCTCKSLKPTSARLFSSKSGVSSCPWDISLNGGWSWGEKGERGVCWDEPSPIWDSFFSFSCSCLHQNVTSARRSATRSDEFISKVPCIIKRGQQSNDKGQLYIQRQETFHMANTGACKERG